MPVRECLLTFEEIPPFHISFIYPQINGVWIFIAGVLCFLMQAGFGLLEVGSIRAKNAQNVLLKNIIDGCAAALIYWATGFGLALGEGGNPFLGKTYFFLIGYEDQLVIFFFFYVFAATTATIVSGAVAERCRFRAYLVYTFVLTGFIYPVNTHWLWSPDGFLHGHVVDYAGGGAVHMVGGAAALAGAWIIGPRIGRFTYDESTKKWSSNPIPGHNAVLAATGAFILWFGFFPFNAASGFAIVGDGFAQVGRVATVTALAGAAGCFTLLGVGFYFHEEQTIDLGLSINGLLSGMVATCSGVGYYDPWAGIPVGITGALSYYAFALLLEKLRIDDPIGAAPVHLAAGGWGLICAAFFTNGAYLDGATADQIGIFFGGNGILLGWQLAALLLDFAWPFTTCSLMFWTMNRYGILRVSEEAEKMGMDHHHHGGSAYRWDSVVTGPSTQSISASKTNANVGTASNSGADEEIGETAPTNENESSNHSSNELRRRSAAALRTSMMPTPYGAL